MPRASDPKHRFVQAYLKQHHRAGLPQGESLAYHGALMKEAWRLAKEKFGPSKRNPLTKGETRTVEELSSGEWKEGYRVDRDLQRQGFLWGRGSAFGQVARDYGSRNPCPICHNPIVVLPNTVAVGCPGCGAVLGVK